MLDVLIAAWLTAATVRELPGQPPVVLAVGRTVPATGGWPDLARTVVNAGSAVRDFVPTARAGRDPMAWKVPAGAEWVAP